jgi:DNA-directed RNA polymerase specialized sigma24 family protein
MQKNTIDIFINKYYEDLYIRAINITKNKEKAIDLISFLVEYLYRNTHKLSLLKGSDINKVLLAYSTKFMYNQWNWCRSDFNILNKNNFKTKYLEETNENFDKGFEEDIILIETKDELYKEEFNSLSDYDEIKRDKIITTKKYYNQLTPHYKTLYDLYFNDDLSITKISKIIGIPASAVFQMLKELKSGGKLFYKKNKKL